MGKISKEKVTLFLPFRIWLPCWNDSLEFESAFSILTLENSIRRLLLRILKNQALFGSHPSTAKRAC